MGNGNKGGNAGSDGVFDSALQNLRSVWREVIRLSSRSGANKDARPEALRDQIEACLSGQGGEVSARSRAAGLARSYLDFSDKERLVFLSVLATEFGVDQEQVDDCVEAWRSASDEDLEHQQRALRDALHPRRMELLRKFNALQSGPRFLVELRKDLLDWKKEHPQLAELEVDVKELLKSWFDVGFLELRSINWHAPASLLEKLGRYEAVHRVRSWQDLKNRLDTDRRCFAFFHPCMPDEPLIFIEVALVDGLATQIQDLLDEKAHVLDPEDANTAIFYSISNTQRGLAGISFGSFLIKQVVDRLRRDLPNLKHFSTLSPMPGFSRWLEGSLEEGTLEVSASEAKKLKQVTDHHAAVDFIRDAVGSVKWARDENLADALKPILMRLAAQYLLKEKRSDGKRALDPVAHFHLANGARLQQLNWMADNSAKGLRESAGMMVNYLYRLDRIERFHEDYSTNGNSDGTCEVGLRAGRGGLRPRASLAGGQALVPDPFLFVSAVPIGNSQKRRLPIRKVALSY